jgi:triosephosphate isomerase (TIM)
MARKMIFAGNWKMFTSQGEASGLIDGIKKGLGDIGEKEVVVFPPSVYLKSAAEQCGGTKIAVGAQNMYHAKEGAFTGEISPLMVKDVGAKYILIGHSERRHVFKETDSDVNLKLKAAIEYGLSPVVCVGELLEEREAGNSEKVVGLQVREAFKGLTKEDAKKVIIAYEPVWAIGTGKVATPEIAQSMHGYIRKLVAEIVNRETADIVPILYGGSVKPDNIAGIIKMGDIDGVLVGGASLKSNSFLDIIHVK